MWEDIKEANADVKIDLKQLDGSQFIQILYLPGGYHTEFGILVFHTSPPTACLAL